MKKVIFILSVFVFFTCVATTCTQDAESSSGVQKASIRVNTDANGNTVEQRNIMERLTRDNKPGSIKHLYVMSAYSGQVLIYSTVNGKVTSASKRLTPSMLGGENGKLSVLNSFAIDFNGSTKYTAEVLGDDGSYGSSDPYIYWFDVKGIYHQHYLSGGQIIHISDQPLAVKSVILNMELTNEK
jgi:hypothetical protein